jgi:DNA-binding transcriptional LysR family regulator
MDLRRLRYFVVAAEESNFRRASLRLGTNSSIISRHVRDIEEELGADLFHREPGHGVRLTEVGRAFLNDVREMFGHLEFMFRPTRILRPYHPGISTCSRTSGPEDTQRR